MLEFTTNEWIVLLLVLVLGYLLGLLTRSGGGKWRHQYDEQVRLREAAEARAATAEARLMAADRAMQRTEQSQRGDTGSDHDDLSRIRGISPAQAGRLNEAGVFTYRQIIDLNDREMEALEERLGAPAGTIDREQWREQARLLLSDMHEQHRTRFAG